MALNVQFNKYHNSLIDEEIVITRLVNQQTLDYDKLCDYLADGSTVTASDVSAVMKQLEKKLPFVLALNTKVICSPEGLTFRPSVSGSITQSQLKAKLTAKKAAEQDPEKAAQIDVDRKLATSDLTTGDLTASIIIDLPKKWLERFHADAEFKRVYKVSGETTDETPTDGSGDSGSTDSGNQGTGGSGSNSNPSNPTSSVAAPTISGQTPFANTSEVTLSAESGASVYYTVDGSTPTAESTPYSAPFTLNSTTVVKAIAIKDGVSSEVATKNFTKSSGNQDD